MTGVQTCALPISFYVRLKAKKTGRQYATLMNDEEVPSYMTADFDAGYKFANFGFIKSPNCA